MTKQEKIVVSAYTGIFMCELPDIQAYIEKKMGRPVEPHELGSQKFWAAVREKTIDDFTAICNDDSSGESEG